MNKTIAKVYVSPDLYLDEPNKDIGKAPVGEDFLSILENRRHVTSRMSEKGQRLMNKLKKSIEKRFERKVGKIKFDRHCGCTMCPCSPGFRIMVQVTRNEYTTGHLLDIWLTGDGKIIEESAAEKRYRERMANMMARERRKRA